METYIDDDGAERCDNCDENPKIDDGWLGDWDYPITVDDLVNAVRLVRETDEKELG